MVGLLQPRFKRADDTYMPHPAPNAPENDNSTMGSSMSLLKVGPCY